MVMPVMMFSLVIALITFWFDEQVVPSVSVRSKALTQEIIRSRSSASSDPIAKTIVQENKLVLAIVARNVNPVSQTLEGVVLIAYDGHEHESYIMRAKELQFDFNRKEHWRIQGGLTLTDANFTYITHASDAWPSQIPKIEGTIDDITAERNDEFDLMSMRSLKASIEKHRKLRDWTFAEIANAEYGYWNKISVPIAAFVFGTLGAVLGIRNHRTGTAVGFALAIAIIFGYVTLASFMNIFATGGILPAYVASFSPITLGFVASVIIMWRRNV
jgi:lipopolysaccharide export system permease protein